MKLFEKLLNKLGYYKKDEYSIYLLEELIKTEDYVIEEMEDKEYDKPLYNFIRGRRSGYQEALDMINEYYKT